MCRISDIWPQRMSRSTGWELLVYTLPRLPAAGPPHRKIIPVPSFPLQCVVLAVWDLTKRTCKIWIGCLLPSFLETARIPRNPGFSWERECSLLWGARLCCKGNHTTFSSTPWCTPSQLASESGFPSFFLRKEQLTTGFVSRDALRGGQS